MLLLVVLQLEKRIVLSGHSLPSQNYTLRYFCLWSRNKLLHTSTVVSLTTAQTHNLLVQSQRSKGWHMGWQFIRLGSRIHLKKYYEEWWQIGCDRRKSPVEAEEAFLSFSFLCKTVSIDQWCVLCLPFQVHPLHTTQKASLISF